MEIRFKFRSSPSYDTLDIGLNSDISIIDLKSLIASKMHINLSHGVDLVFYDSNSELEYKDGNTRIASGSSVIIKRIPAKPAPLLREFDVPAGHVGSGDVDYVNYDEPPLLDFGVNECDDFGVDLCPPPVATEFNHQKLPSNFNQKKDPLSIRAGAVKNIALERTDLPSELRCPLCTTFFEEAVMIPCCQHSFCEKCISLALVENSRCPKCSSTKCRPEDLLPNISLRQTVKRFLESQPPDDGLENDLYRYAPDGESGIQVRQLSCAPTVRPRDMQLNRCATKISDKLLGTTEHDPVALDDCAEFEGESEPVKTVGANEEAANCGTKKVEAFAVTGGGERNFVASARLNKGFRTCYNCGSPDHLIRECPAAASAHTSNWCGNVPFQEAFPGYTPQYWPGNPPHGGPPYNMYCGPEMMVYNTNMAAAMPFGLPPYTPMFSGYPVTSGSIRPEAMAFVSGINAQQMNQADVPGPMGYAKRGNHSEAFERGEVFERNNHNVSGPLNNAERVPNHSGGSFSRKSARSNKSRERSDDDDKYSNGKRQEMISNSSEGGRQFRNAQLNGQSSEKVVPDSWIRPPAERHDNFYRSSKRKEDMRENHDNDLGHIQHHSNKESIQRREYDRSSERNDDMRDKHDNGSSHIHHYSNKVSIQRREHNRNSKRNEDMRERHYRESSHIHHQLNKESIQRRREHDRRSGRQIYSHSSYSSSDERQRRDDSGPRSRDSKRDSKPNGKGIYHERERVTKYSDDDYGDDYHSHKRSRYH